MQVLRNRIIAKRYMNVVFLYRIFRTERLKSNCEFGSVGVLPLIVLLLAVDRFVG